MQRSGWCWMTQTCWLRTIPAARDCWRWPANSAGQVLHHQQSCLTGCCSVHAVRALLANGARVDDESATGFLPLHYAALRGHVDCLRSLHVTVLAG